MYLDFGIGSVVVIPFVRRLVWCRCLYNTGFQLSNNFWQVFALSFVLRDDVFNKVITCYHVYLVVIVTVIVLNIIIEGLYTSLWTSTLSFSYSMLSSKFHFLIVLVTTCLSPYLPDRCSRYGYTLLRNPFKKQLTRSSRIIGCVELFLPWSQFKSYLTL